jgi:hypothetical protein
VRIATFLLFLLSAPLLAQPVPVVRFDPPDPTPRTAVTAHVHVPNAGCGATGAIVSRAGQNINISLQLALIQCVVPAPADVSVDLGLLPPGVYTVGVSPGNLLSLIAERELVVREATPPFDVRPNTHGSASGDIIRLTAKDIGTPSAVRFGTVAAEIFSVSPNEILVREPLGLAPGTYDVTIERSGVPLTAIAAFHVPKPAPAMVNEAFYERVLLPVFWSGPGAFGAQWETEATLHNANEYAITSAHTTLFFFFCPFLCDTRPPANTTLTVKANSSTIAGIVEELPRQATAKIDFGLVIRDTSRADQDLGTEIPVVRDAQFFARTFSIPNVPTDPRYRLTLRLYDVDGATVFGLRIYKRGATTPTVNEGIALTAQEDLRNGGFAVINDLLAKYPQLAGFGPLRVEIDPLIRDGMRSAWGFLTVTNNDTQHVTVLSPQ